MMRLGLPQQQGEAERGKVRCNTVMIRSGSGQASLSPRTGMQDPGGSPG